MTDTPEHLPSLRLRNQKICVLRRNGLYWLGSTGWTENIGLAKVFPQDQMHSKARIDIGMPCEMVWVSPAVIEDCEPEMVGGDAPKLHGQFKARGRK